MVHKGASDGHALALTAREFVGSVRHAVSKVNGLESLLRHFMSLRRTDATVNQRQLNIVKRSRAGEQIERLKNKPDFLIANASQFVVVHLGDVLAVEPVFTLCRRIETANQVHQGRLART